MLKKIMSIMSKKAIIKAERIPQEYQEIYGIIRKYRNKGQFEDLIDEDEKNIINKINLLNPNLIYKLVVRQIDIFPYINNPTDVCIIRYLLKYPEKVRDYNVSENVACYLIERNFSYIHDFDNISFKMAHTVFRHHSHLPEIRKLKLSEDVILKLIDFAPKYVQLIPTLTENVIKLFINKYPKNIMDLTLSEEMKKWAIENNSECIVYMDNPSDELIEIACTHDEKLIKYFPKISKELKYKIIEKNPNILIHMAFPEKDMIDHALKSDKTSDFKQYYFFNHVKYHNLAEYQKSSLIQNGTNSNIFYTIPPEAWTPQLASMLLQSKLDHLIVNKIIEYVLKMDEDKDLLNETVIKMFFNKSNSDNKEELKKHNNYQDDASFILDTFNPENTEG